jgi:hypothetical protein
LQSFRKESAGIPEFREKLLKFEAEKKELRQEIKTRSDEPEKIIADYSVKIGKLNTIYICIYKRSNVK